MISPCVNRCRMDPITEHCTSCKRSLKEITDWITYTEEQRKAIMQELKIRDIK